MLQNWLQDGARILPRPGSPSRNDHRLVRVLSAGAFGGGEGALREDLPALVAHARARGLTPTLTTSGLGVDAARARALAGLAQVNVSWDGPAEVYEAVRGYRGAPQAERAVRHLQAAGVPVGLNTVLTRENVGQLEAIGEGAEALGAVELQLLRFKPSGRGSLDYLARRLTPAQVEALPGALRRLSARHPFALRVDCAMVPFLAADPEVGLEALQAFGVMGCEAGRSLMTVDAHGRTAPCSFWRHQRSSARLSIWHVGWGLPTCSQLTELMRLSK